MPLFFGRRRIGARQEDGEVGVLRPGGPHLLPAHHPLVAVAHRLRRQRREVGPGAGLAEELAPLLLVAHDRTEEAQLLLVGAVREQRRRGVVEPERIERAEVERREHGAHRGRGLRRHAQAAVLRRPRRHHQSRRPEHRVPRLVVGPAPHLTDRGVAAACRGVAPRDRHVLLDPRFGARHALVDRGRRVHCEPFAVHRHNVRVRSGPVRRRGSRGYTPP